jgi:hypothetical protein
MAINQLSTANTFEQWLVATQVLIEKTNYYESTANLVFETANNTLNVYSNTVNVYVDIQNYVNTAFDAANAANVVANNALATAQSAYDLVETIAYSGYSGFSGISGYSGFSGFSGIPGLDGGKEYDAIEIINTNTTANDNVLYIITSDLTLTLPTTPNVGVFIGVTNLATTSNSILARNGEKIMDLEEDMTIDVSGAGFSVIYTGSSNGWIIIK